MSHNGVGSMSGLITYPMRLPFWPGQDTGCERLMSVPCLGSNAFCPTRNQVGV